MEKDKKNKKDVTATVPNQPNVQTTALTIIPKTETLEEQNKKLEAEVQQLKAELSKVPQTLEARIEYIQVKQGKIKQLTKLEENSDKLFGHLQEIEKLGDENDFKCDKYNLSVNDTSSYKDAPIFTMNNPIIIRDVIKFVLQRIDEKMDVLKMEIAD